MPSFRPLTALLALRFAAFVALAAAVASLGLPQPALAQADGRSVRAERYDVTLAVQQGGDVMVTETLVIRFSGGPFTRAFRRIPTNRLEGVRDVRVEEGGQLYRPGRETPATFAVSGATRGGGGDVTIEWWFSPATNVTRTFVIQYRAAGAVRFYDGGDQLRWQVFGADRGYAIDAATITLRLPADIPADRWMLDAYPRQFVRQSGVAGSASVSWAAAGLPPGQDLEVRAQWPHGIIAGSPPAWQAAADAEDWRRENLAPVLTLGFGALAILIPLFGGLAVLVLWYTRGRDPSIGRVAPELDTRPSDLPPGVAGTLVDGGADVQDAVATLLDLAARGVIAITDIYDPDLAGSSHDFEIELLVENPPGLRRFEQVLLDTLFHRGRKVRLSQLGGWFHRSIPVIQELLYHEAVDAGLFVENPDQVRRRYRRLGSAIGVGALILGLVACGAVPSYAQAIFWPFVSMALVGVMLYYVGGHMPRRTPHGAIEAARWHAYARYLARLDHSALKDRMAAFEHTLPDAVALGVERTWVHKLATVGTPAPRWLRQPPVVVVGGPMWGGPMWGGPHAGGGWTGGRRGPFFPGGVPGGGSNGRAGGAPAGTAPGPRGPQGWSDAGAGGLERGSGSLVDLLNAVSDVLSRGGGSGWSGGGGGGGSFGGGGGGSGGGGSGFS